jgi:hypothetical protein
LKRSVIEEVFWTGMQLTVPSEPFNGGHRAPGWNAGTRQECTGTSSHTVHVPQSPFVARL